MQLKQEGKNKVQLEERGKHGWLLTLSAKQKAVRAGCLRTGKELEQHGHEFKIKNDEGNCRRFEQKKAYGSLK